MHGKRPVNDISVPEGGLVLLAGGAAVVSGLGIKQPIPDGVQQGKEKLRFSVQVIDLNS